jgi:hypothetical protein
MKWLPTALTIAGAANLAGIIWVLILLAMR